MLSVSLALDCADRCEQIEKPIEADTIPDLREQVTNKSVRECY